MNPKTIIAYILAGLVAIVVFAGTTLLAAGLIQKSPADVETVAACECSEKSEIQEERYTSKDVVDLVLQRDKLINEKLDASAHEELLGSLADAGYGEFYLDANHKRQFRLKKLVIKKASDETVAKKPQEATSDITTVTLPHEVVRRLPPDLVEAIPPEYVKNLPPDVDESTVKLEGDLTEGPDGTLVGREATALVDKAKEFDVKKKKEPIIERVIKAPFRGLGDLLGLRKDKDKK
jgi:hypothetical protein